MIGTDPEIVLLKGGHPVRWNWDLFPDVLNGRDATGDEPIGQDGTRGPGELRPKAAATPLKLVDNLHALLFTLGCWGKDIGAKAGSYSSLGQPIGGHIHFDWDVTPGVNGNFDLYRTWEWDAATKHKIKLLDLGLALPVSLIENSTERRGRVWIYGMLSSNRRQDWGLEYRPLPSWLISRTMAKWVLTLAAMLWDTPPKYSSASTAWVARTHADLANCWQDDDKTQRKAMFYTATMPIWERLCGLNSQLKKITVPWEQLIEHNVEWNCQDDILPAWGAGKVMSDAVLVDRNTKPTTKRIITTVQEHARPANRSLFIYEQASGIPVLLSSVKRKLTSVEQGFTGNKATRRAALASWPSVRKLLKAPGSLEFLGIQSGPGIEKILESVFKIN